MNVRLEIVQMTPELAAELLARNDPRRTAACNQQLVALYADQMQRGAWFFTADPVKVNVSGGLMDGQHRLQAVIRADWRGPQVIAWNVPDHAAWAMDPPGKAVA